VEVKVAEFQVPELKVRSSVAGRGTRELTPPLSLLTAHSDVSRERRTRP
jgi:hypothetical protein